MNAQSIIPGDVVLLKSGSPLMTASEVFDREKVRCIWFEGYTMKEGVFPRAALEAGTTSGVTEL